MEITPSHNYLRQEHLKRRTLRPFKKTNDQHDNYFNAIILIGIYVQIPTIAITYE